MKKRFVEWDLPLAEISKASSREKSIRHGHPSTLHIWWARRPLASSRATNFAALIDLPDDPKKRKEISQLIEKITPWEAVKNGNDKNVKKAQEMIRRQWGDSIPRVLDPFAGGGSIPMEAIRLGCDTYATDYNPVAVLIEKATLEWPAEFGVMIPHPDEGCGIDGEKKKVNFLEFMIRKWAQKIFVEATTEIGRFHPEDPDGSVPIGYVWTRTIPCQNPNCKVRIPLVKQFWLARKTRKKVAYRILTTEDNHGVTFEIADNTDQIDPSTGTTARGNAVCPACDQTTKVATIRNLAQTGLMDERLAVVILSNPNKKGKHYRISNDNDMNIYEEVERQLESKIESLDWLESPIPNEDLPPAGTLGFRIQRYGMTKWGDLFNSRQKLTLITILEKIRLSYNDIREDCLVMLKDIDIDKETAFQAVVGYLAILLDRVVDSSSKQNVWIPVGEKPAGTFGRQALQMVWDYLENNIVRGSARAWDKQINWIVEFILFASGTGEGLKGVRASVSRATATSLPFQDNWFDAVFTDPPYYDNVPYADLSDFFYVWLKRSVGELFPELFSTPLTPKNEEAVADPAKHKSAVKYFEAMLSGSFREIHRVLKPNGVATIVYGHKTTSGWETMLNSLVDAGLVVTASWPLHTERPGRLRGQKSAALASSIYMVCRKTEREGVGFYNEIQPLIKSRIEKKLQQFWNEGIVGGDFFISAIGPGMEVFSRYERVDRLSGEQVTTVELLNYIRSISTDFIVRKLLKGASSANIDSESDFYLAYRWTYLDNTVDYDDARKLASASGVNLEDLWGSEGFVKKSGSKISVLGPKDRDDISSIRSMVDVVHKCLLLWEKGRKEEIAELLAGTGFRDDPAFKQFCQAVAECLLSGSKEKQLLEGFLMGVDDYAKAEIKTRKDQTDLRLFGGR